MYDDVPEIYYKALVAVEDRRFYKHKGFDIIGTARAIYNDIRAWELLEFYVNGIYYGSGYYCIYDASIGYFDKEPKDMTDYECTLLAGIPNAPSVYSLDVRPDLAKQRQEKVVECMVEVKYITEDKAAEIIGDYK